MATLQDIEKCYDWIDLFHETRLGECADFTCAFFNGDFSLSLPQAQRAKHEWILGTIGFKPGMRILDIGCGWGPMLKAITDRGGHATGLTLSPAQARYCKAKGFDVQLLDYKKAMGTIGHFDDVVSVGAFEHFCSPEEFVTDTQDRIYQDFFEFCNSVLHPGGRLFLQTMTWGQHYPDLQECTMDAPKGSDNRIIARLLKFYPGSWLPSGKDQIVQNAEKHFDFLFSNNGRRDYIETLNRWGLSTKNLIRRTNILKTTRSVITLMPRLRERDFRIQLKSVLHNDQQESFIREIMSHERIFFEKKR